MKHIKLVADIHQVDGNRLIFRASIDEAFPETVMVTITKERWEKEFHRATEIPIELFRPDVEAHRR